MSAALESGQVLAERYALQRPLGRGPGGESWLAQDKVTGLEVVLKFAIPRPAAPAAERLRRERATLAAVTHEALLPAGRIEERAGQTFLVHDYLPGGDLSRLRGRPWPFVLRRVLPVLDALRALHEAGFVHGDLKSANVLLDADGLPKLADGGSARPIGATGAAEGSPYGMSPQRFDGAPAAVADDVYAVGALLYELIGGHPPFYPDITAERVRAEVPAPLAARLAVPPKLNALIARCLAKEPLERPADMSELRRLLQECLALAAGAQPSSAAVGSAVLRPPTEPAPIRPQWRRGADSGPSATELRREGFRRGVLVSAAILAFAAFAFVFFVLPGLVQPPGPATSVAPPPAAPARSAGPGALPPPQDLEKLAELKRQAEQLRSPLDARFRALEQRDVAVWGAAAYADARKRLASADAALAARQFAAAIDSVQGATRAVSELERQAPQVLRSLVAQGNVALDAGRSADARQKFEAALRIESTSAAAKTGLKRSQVLDEVLKECAAASRLEQDGDARAAMAAYQRALALDPENRAARAALARLAARASGDAFSAAMAQGLAALARTDYEAARRSFERAGQLRPGAPEVAEGLRQVEQAGRTRELSATLARARKAEQEERWSEALGAYRAALKADPALLEAQQAVERCEPRAMLDAELQSFIDHPERLFSQDTRGVARGLLARAAQFAPPGARLTGQLARVKELLQQAETPIRVAIASDNATDVQIYRVGRLGMFERRDLELMPGRYTVVGSRSGYRDVRKELNLLPGAAAPVLEIRCEERI